ncbi:hypothetical protein [Mucilaginibacter sp. HD30]
MAKKILLVEEDEAIVYQTGYHWAHYFSPKGLVSGFIIPVWRQLHDSFLVTTHKIIAQRTIPEHYLEIYLLQVKKVEMKQYLIGRTLGFGTIVVTGTGDHTYRLLYIKNPKGFVEAYRKQVSVQRAKANNSQDPSAEK